MSIDFSTISHSIGSFAFILLSAYILQRHLRRNIDRALLIDTAWPGWLDVALALDCMAVVTNHRIMDAALLSQLRQAGLRAACYTVNEEDDARRLLALGVDGIITDAVDHFSPVAGAVG